ncbi:MAG: toll/interleukin-1 receptor domain-containing protein [Prevotella sp.]|nr:toll/interleukin-1 receptor domain-containing protein [Prevotella sp.]
MGHKMFISHSSVQKPYVEELVKLIGTNFLAVDKYTFESGERLWEEIRNSIDECEHFVYLISQEALDSDWVKKEISYVRERIDEGLINFYPVIINKDVEIDNPKIPKWIKNEYLVKEYISPNILSILLKRKILRSIWEEFPSLQKQVHLFIGRDEELQRLSELYFSNTGSSKNTLIVSGLSYIGRKRLLREFVSKRIFVRGDSTDLIDVRLTDTDSISEFAIQLNDMLGLYPYTSLLTNIQDKENALSITISLLNELHEMKENIVINDDNCIVKNNGRLTEWFVDLIKDDRLHNHLHCSIASRYTPRPDLSQIFPHIVALQIHPLKKNNMELLFNAYAALKGIEISPTDMYFFIDNLSGYPGQIFSVIDSIADSNIAVAKRKVDNLVCQYDQNYHTIISEIKNNDRIFQILILLSHFEFISYDYLCSICGEEIADVLEQFHYLSLTESFGLGKQYICLNPAIVDYIRRVKFKLSPEYSKKIKEITSQIIIDTDDRITDISYRLYAAKNNLKEGVKGGHIDERYLLPSLVLKVIMEEYYEGHNNTVIFLADRIKKGYHKKMYEDVIRSINYWLCCALCRNEDSRFFDEISYFKDSLYSYNFLMGFYYRHKKRYEKAKEYYGKALENVKQYDDDNYSSKAEHEMVMVCMFLGRYNEALDLARHSYERSPSNTYHIESYFRCLVRTAHPDKEMLEELMEGMHNSLDSHRDTIYKTMKAEYVYYVNKDFLKAIDFFKEAIRIGRDSYRNYPVKSLKEICKKEDAMTIATAVMRDYGISGEETIR